jgi:hypothetical protein
MDKLSSSADGWYLNYIRLHIDPYWTNDPGPAIPENDISRFNYNRLVTYTDQVIIPLINHARSRGMYVILRPPGVCPSRIAVNDAYHSYLKRVWTFLSQHPGLKNADNVMFELANEPVEILGTNGTWGTTGNEHFAALKNFFQPLVNIIRNNGANNVCWVPGTGWQSHYQGYVNNQITGVILVMLFTSIQGIGAVSIIINPFRMHGISMLSRLQILLRSPLLRPTGHRRDMVPSVSVQQVRQAETDLAPI